MLQIDTYEARVRTQLNAKNIPHSDKDISELLDEYYPNTTPGAAITGYFAKLRTLKRVANRGLERIESVVFEEFGLPKEGSKDHKTAVKVICYIVIEKMELRPFSVTRKRFDMANDGMVFHAMYKAKKMMEESDLFNNRVYNALDKLGL